MMKPARRLNFHDLSASPFVLEQKQLKKTSRRRFPGGWDFLQILALVFLMTAGLIFIHSIGEQIGTAQARAFFPRQLGQVSGMLAV